MKHARLYSALPRVSAPRVRSNSAASTSRALSLASSFFDGPPQTGPPPPNTRLTTHRLPIEARGEVEGPNTTQAGRDAPLALVAPPHTPGNGHNTNHHHPHPAQLGALLFPCTPNHAGRHTASAPAAAGGRAGRRRGQRYTLDVGAYGIPKRGQRVRAMHTSAGGYAERTDAPLAVQVGEDAYFVRENAMGVADGVGGWARVKHAAPPTGPSASALFARRLMHFCADEVDRASHPHSHAHSSQTHAQQHPHASTSSSRSPPVVTPWRAGSGYSRFAPYPMASSSAAAGAGGSLGPWQEPASAFASGSASASAYGSAPNANFASAYNSASSTPFAPWHDPLYDNPWRDASSSSSTSASPYYEDNEYSDYEYDGAETGTEELLAAELDELADGLDVLRILERAYERTLGAHVVPAPSSDLNSSAFDASPGIHDSTPVQLRNSAPAASTAVPRPRPRTTERDWEERGMMSTSLPASPPSPLSVASASASASLRTATPPPPPSWPFTHTHTQRTEMRAHTPQPAKEEQEPKTIPLLAGSSTALVAVLDYVPRGEVAGFEVLASASGTAGSGSTSTSTSTAAASATATAAKEDADAELTPVLKIAHVGDCMGMLVREGAVQWRSEEMWWRWNTPVQLSAATASSGGATFNSTTPSREGSRGGSWWASAAKSTPPAGGSGNGSPTTGAKSTQTQTQTHGEVTPSSAAHLFTLPVRAGDIVILASDGLSDNLWDEDVLEEVGRVGRAWADAGAGAGESCASSSTAFPVFGADGGAETETEAGAGAGEGMGGQSQVDSARLRRRTLAGMLSEALCSRARRVATRRAGREAGRRCVVGGAAAASASTSSAVPEAGKSEEDGFKSELEDEDDTPFARRARETGRAYRGGKNDDISVIVAVIAPAEEHTPAHAHVGKRRMEAARAAGS